VETSSAGNPTATATGLAPVGTTVTYARTISESDVYLFAGITGDIGPNHTNAQYMAGTRYGQRVAHGALTLGLMSTCSTRLIEMLGDTPTVNYGYDKVRFPAPLPVGSRLRMRATLTSVEDVAGGVQIKITQTFEREGGDKPVCVAEALTRVYDG
jgi:acyl dehydratase